MPVPASASSATSDDRIAHLEQAHKRLRRLDAWVSRGRGITFLVACLLGYLGLSQIVWPPAGYVMGSIFFALFVALVGYHEALLHQQTQLEIRIQYQRTQQARRDRRWESVPRSPLAPAADARVGARDLDLFGERSVSQLIDDTYTPRGRTTLVDWLAHPAAVPVIVARQQAVQWLAAQSQFREDVAMHGRILADRGARPDELVQWGETPGWLPSRPWALWLPRVLAAGIVMLLVLLLQRAIAPEWSLIGFGLLTISTLFNAFYAGRVHDIFNRISRGENETTHYGALLEAVWNLPPECETFQQLRAALAAGDVDFDKALRSLRRWVWLSSGRRSGAFTVFYFVAQIFVLWDFHVLAGLERWQRRYGPALSHWFAAVGQLEALCSLAGLAHNHPDWCYPTVLPPAPDRFHQDVSLQATQIGHPLLPTDACVRNDVAIGPPGRFLFITGSNMSGKSTLLRALGVNIVLAQAGSPVCATTMTLTPIQLETSIRVDDSLADGVSFFMAELKRLKHIVDQAHNSETKQGPQLFFLLDEILQGTNSQERHIAVEHILAHLVAMRATGAVTTHDIELCHADSLKAHCDNFHFRETFIQQGDKQQMTFDYQLRPGVCPTTNALKLMEMVGL